MFIVLLRYLAPIEDIDRALPAHRDWVDRAFGRGIFVLTGPRVPRDGGVIMAHGVSRAELDAYLEQDPFNQAKLVAYEVIEMAPRGADPRLAFLVKN